MFRFVLALGAALVSSAQAADTGPANVFDAYEAAIAAGDSAAVAGLIGDHPAPTPFSRCPPALSDRDCLIDYLNRTVVTTHSVITPIAVTVTGNIVAAKLEVRNDLTRAAGIERLAGTDRLEVVDGKIVAFAFLRDETDPQTRQFFQYMMMHGGPGGGAAKP